MGEPLGKSKYWDSTIFLFIPTDLSLLSDFLNYKWLENDSSIV